MKFFGVFRLSEVFKSNKSYNKIGFQSLIKILMNFKLSIKFILIQNSYKIFIDCKFFNGNLKVLKKSIRICLKFIRVIIILQIFL